MKQTVGLNTFRDAFQAVRPDNFSFAGLEVLFDYLEQWENETGEELELNVIALCCDYSEDTLSSVLENYGLESLDELEQRTLVLRVAGFADGEEGIEKRIIYQNY